MKIRLVFMVLLIACLSCGTNNKPVSDAQKEKIKGEVKEVVNKIYKECEDANFDLLSAFWIDSPDFVYIYDGKTYNYKEFSDTLKSFFNSMLNQKVTIVNEKYVVLDNSTVLYTADTKWLTNFKNGHSVLSDPWAMQTLFKKIDNGWKELSMIESGHEKIVKSKEPLKKLNQVELVKQNIGSWKCDISKDTTCFWDVKPYGTGLECYYKYVTKGKIVIEGKQLFGYDMKVDKYIVSFLPKGMDMEIWAIWYVSKNKYIMLPYSDISNPEKASFKYEEEFKSPDLAVETMFVNGKSVETDTWTRVK
jgi:hypothetical protein